MRFRRQEKFPSSKPKFYLSSLQNFVVAFCAHQDVPRETFFT
ncbi:MAG: hypothetical protein ACI9CZ_001777, partial [Flavobacterium sp.]